MTLKRYLIAGVGAFIIAVGAAIGIQSFGEQSFGASVFAVFQGGTGTASFGQGWVNSSGGTGALVASTSPTVNYITATSTSRASTLPNASTSLLTVSGNAWLTNLAVAAGTVLAVDNNGKIIATTTSSASLTGTTGQVPYFSGTNTAVGTSTLFLSTAGYLAVASSTPLPQYALDIFGDININPKFVYRFGGQPILSSSSTPNNLYVGEQAGISLTTGQGETFVGWRAGHEFTTGGFNTAVGSAALFLNTTGTENTAVGYQALENPFDVAFGSRNTCMGSNCLNLTTGNNNTALGYQAGNLLTTGSFNILIGNNVQATSTTASNSLNIGNMLYGVSPRIGVATDTPASLFSVGSSGSATTTIFLDSASAKGTCLVMKDADGTGYTYVSANNGALTASTASCQ